MKLSELRPCDQCGGKVTPIFYRVVVEQHLLDAGAVNEVLGLRQMFSGSLRMAEAMASRPDATKVLTPATETLLLCQDCGISALGQAIEAKACRAKQPEAHGDPARAEA